MNQIPTAQNPSPETLLPENLLSFLPGEKRALALPPFSLPLTIVHGMHPGKKLLGAVNIIFIICIVFAVIFGLITWVGVAASIGGAGGFVFGLIVAFLLVALVLFCAWLYLVTLAIFAKLHDDVHQLGSTVKKIEEKLSIEE